MAWRCSFCSSLLRFLLGDVSLPFGPSHVTPCACAPSSSCRNACDARRGRRHSHQLRVQCATSAGMAGSNRSFVGFERKAKFQSQGKKPRFKGDRSNGRGGHGRVGEANGKGGTSRLLHGHAKGGKRDAIACRCARRRRKDDARIRCPHPTVGPSPNSRDVHQRRLGRCRASSYIGFCRGENMVTANTRVEVA